MKNFKYIKYVVSALSELSTVEIEKMYIVTCSVKYLGHLERRWEEKYDARQSSPIKALRCYMVISMYTGARVAQWVRSLDLTTHTGLSPIRVGSRPAL